MTQRDDTYQAQFFREFADPDEYPEWWLPTPYHATGLEVDKDYLISCWISHGVRAGIEPSADDLPVVASITEIRRRDDHPLGHSRRVPAIDLHRLAADALAQALGTDLIVSSSKGVLSSATPHQWRVIGEQLREFAYANARMRWSTEIDNRLIEIWNHMAEHECGTAVDLAEILGTTKGSIYMRLTALRKEGYPIATGRKGRPPLRKEEE